MRFVLRSAMKIAGRFFANLFPYGNGSLMNALASGRAMRAPATCTRSFAMKQGFYDMNAWHWQGKLPWVVRDSLAYL